MNKVAKFPFQPTKTTMALIIKRKTKIMASDRES
jgi:hypothetical protein